VPEAFKALDPFSDLFLKFGGHGSVNRESQEERSNIVDLVNYQGNNAWLSIPRLK
jgi:hypothetical protein